MQCEKWLKVVSNLRVDRKGTIAPHKPLLLLVLAELGEEGKLTSKFLPLTGELVFRFLTYWTVVAERRPQRPDIHLPFYHMRGDGCWTPLNSHGQPTLERRRAVAAVLDETFLACLNEPDFRKEMRRLLIAKYFSDFSERTALYQLVGVPVPPDVIVREDARLYEAARERGREARFRLTVVPAYSHLPPAKPEAWRLLAPQRGLSANGTRKDFASTFIKYYLPWLFPMTLNRLPCDMIRLCYSQFHHLRKSQTLRVPRQSRGFTND